MVHEAMSADDARSLGRLKVLVWLAVAALAIAVLAGVLLLAIDPVSGSSSEAALGITAAIAGISTGVLVIVALIYAQVKNLWQYAPTGIRVALWVLIAIGVAVTLWNMISQPFST